MIFVTRYVPVLKLTLKGAYIVLGGKQIKSWKSRTKADKLQSLPLPRLLAS